MSNAIAPPGLKRQPIEAVAVCTIISKNYLAQARVLGHSLAKHHPNIPLYVLLVDQEAGYFDPSRENFELILAEDLKNIPDLRQFLFKYTVLELNTAVKPFFLEHLFDRYGLKKLVYFDPDILICSPLDTIWDLLDTYSAVLTPHITDRIDDRHRPGEDEFLRRGTFNLGFVALSVGPSMQEFLSWWQKRLYDFCLVDDVRGYFTDQKWVNLAPYLFDGFYALPAPEYNVAYWNLNARGNKVRMQGETVLYGDKPLAFFHFSGYSPDKPNDISKYQDRFTFQDLPALRPLFDCYRAYLCAHGHDQVKNWPYAYGSFDNGVRIPDIARKVYRELQHQAREFGDPFATKADRSFLDWLRTSVGAELLWREIYHIRPDIQRRFPDPFGTDKGMFYEWLRRAAPKEYDIDAELLPLRAASVSAGSALPPPGDSARRWLATTVRYQAHTAKMALIKRLQSNPKMLARLVRLKRRLHGGVAPAPAARAMPVQLSLPFGVNVVGYLAGEFGIAEASRGFVHALKAANVPMALHNIVVPNKRYQDATFTEFTEENPYRVNLLTVNADMVAPTAQKKGTKFFQGRYNIGLWYWELPEFPQIFWPGFALFQEIWVTSAFCAESIGKAAPIPVVKITAPILIDESHIRPSRKRFGLPEGAFTFVFSFDYHSFIERKNPFAVVEAFRRGPACRKDAMLVIKSINSQMYPEMVERLKRAAEGLAVRFIDEYLDRAGTLSLFATCDCLVSLHRSEGLGLGIAEAMYLGKPVIATGYSGNMDFMDVNNSLPVRFCLVELTEDYGPYTRGNLWADPDVDHAAERMSFVYENRGVAACIGQRAAQDIRTRMNPAVTGQEIRARLMRVASGEAGAHCYHAG